MKYIISADRVKADISKVTAITQIPLPEDRKYLQRLLDMTRFLTQFNQDEATLTAPLRMLLRKDMAWQWHPELQAALERLKKAISTTALLKFFQFTGRDRNTSGCIQRWSWSCSDAKLTAYSLCIQSSVWGKTKLCPDKKRTPGNRVRTEEVSPVCL